MSLDLVVIGAGMAGMVAAVRAAGRGLKVAVLEKGDVYAWLQSRLGDARLTHYPDRAHDTGEQKQVRYARTMAAYEREFGTPDLDWWPGTTQHSDCRCRRHRCRGCSSRSS